MNRIAIIAVVLGLSLQVASAADRAAIAKSIMSDWESCIIDGFENRVNKAVHTKKLEEFELVFAVCESQILERHSDLMYDNFLPETDFYEATDQRRVKLRTKLKFIIMGCDDQCQAVYDLIKKGKLP